MMGVALKHTIAQAIPRIIKLMIVKAILLGVENHFPLFMVSQKMAGMPSVQD
jgi:hypothetical protein